MWILLLCWLKQGIFLGVCSYVYSDMLLFSCKQQLSCLDSLQHHVLYYARLLCPWGVPGKNTEVSCHSLLQGIFQLRDLTCLSCLAGRFFTAEPFGRPLFWYGPSYEHIWGHKAKIAGSLILSYIKCNLSELKFTHLEVIDFLYINKNYLDLSLKCLILIIWV